MNSIEGKYYDGQRSVSQSAAITFFEPDRLQIKTANEKFSVLVSDLKVSDKVGLIPRKLTWGSKGYVLCDDDANFNAFLKQIKHKKGSFVAKLERNFFTAVVALIAVGVFVIAGLAWGLPKAAKTIAHNLPDSIYNSASEKMLAQLDSFYFEPSTLSEARQEELRAYFMQEGNPEFDIHFRSMSGIPNAMSISGGDIIFTDELVNMAESDEELLSIYFHEMGHSEARHSEQMLIQQAGLSVILIGFTGDVSGVADVLVTLPLALNQLSHSRKFEREADDVSFNALVEKGYDPQVFADILSRMSQIYGDDESCLAEQTETVSIDEEIIETEVQEKPEVELTESNEVCLEETDDNGNKSGTVFDYLSTHPATKERIERFEDYSKAHFQ